MLHPVHMFVLYEYAFYQPNNNFPYEQKELNCSN